MPGYRPHLDGVRALAVMLVVFFHLGFAWMPGGFIGVDVFFVLSGYLITGLLLTDAAEHGRIRLWRFYARRVRRLVPAALVVLIAVSIASSVWLSPLAQIDVVGDAQASALNYANWHIAAADGDYFAPGDIPGPLVHFWSLAVEEQFYLLWPPLLLGLLALGGAARAGTRVRPVLAGLGLIGITSAVLSVVLTPSGFAYYGLHTRAYQLLAGAALAVLAFKLRRRGIAEIGGERAAQAAAALAGAGALAALVWLAHSIDGASNYPGWAGIAVTAASALLIAVLDLGPSAGIRRAVGAAPAAALGRISYSLYLWHWPVIVFLGVIAGSEGIPWLDGWATKLAATFVLATACYLAVEVPLRRRVAPRAAPRPALATALACSALVAVFAVPALLPTTEAERVAHAAVRDRAPTANCPYFEDEWPLAEDADPCVYRDGGPTTVAIVGDSHAQQWQPAFDEIAAEHDLTVIRVARGGCPANDITPFHYDAQGLPSPDEECARWRHAVYPELIDDYDPELIFVATRSHVVGITDGPDPVLPSDPGHADAWARSWDWTLEALGAGGALVVVSTIMPTLPEHVPVCLAEEGLESSSCDFAAADPEAAPFNRALERITAAHGATLIDPVGLACPGGACDAVTDGVINHRDDNHLSATYARSLAPGFERLLRRAGAPL
jgi:peptidoglycan/LPS O-acetylase OafA/YrhL